MNMAAEAQPSVEALSDSCLLLRLGERIDPVLNRRVHELAAALRQRPFDWIEDLVPAYASLAVFAKPEAITGGAITLESVARLIQETLDALPDGESTVETGRLVQLPVCYGGEFGPDLESLADELGLSPAALVKGHSAPEYRVALLGFAPGFPYLLGMDPSLGADRLATPRAVVPAGSVGIAGLQTGIYPRASPGGWRLIGRCPLALFDPQRESPALLAPGDRLRFVPIEASEFARLGAAP
jgi:KipI family sensor histidine kinase inhibitor